MAGTYDGTNLRFYVDGTQVGSPKPSAPPGYDITHTAFYVDGYPYPCDPSDFPGQIDEVRLYSRALTGAELTTLASAEGDAPPQLPDDILGDWYELGTGASPVNHDAAVNATMPALAALGNRPQVAWNENSTLRVAALTGSLLSPRPWQEYPSPVNSSSAPEKGSLRLKVFDSTPYVAWTEGSGETTDVGRVSLWDGGAWQSVGGPLNTGGGDTSAIDLTSIGGVLYAAYIDNNGTNTVRVARYNAGTDGWDAVGGVVSDYSSADLRIAAVGSTPGVVFTQFDTTLNKSVVMVKRWNGSTWEEVGSGPNPLDIQHINGATDSAIASVAGTPYVAYSEGGSPKVKRFDGSAWVYPGEDTVDQAANENGRYPSIADVDGTPYVAWVAQAVGDPSDQHPEIHVADLVNGSWQRVGGALDHEIGFDVGAPDLIGLGDQPVVAWSEMDDAATIGEGQPNPDANFQVRAAVFGKQPQNTVPPVLSGTPKIGSTLHCTQGTWAGGPTSFVDIWERGPHDATPTDPEWHAIGGASGPDYVVQAADEGSRVRCRVIASNAVISGEAVSDSLVVAADVPIIDDAPHVDGAVTKPRVIGKPIVNRTVSCFKGEWKNDPRSFTYQWFRGPTAIPGANDQSYKLKRFRNGGTVVDANGDGDHQIACQVTARNDVGSSATALSPYVHAVDGKPFNVRKPTVTLSPFDRRHPNPLQTDASCDYAQWYSYYGSEAIYPPYGDKVQWYRTTKPHVGTDVQPRTVPIAGANKWGYRPTTDDLGKQLSCRVTSYNPAGGTSATSEKQFIKLPDGADDTTVYREGGKNPADPTNLLAISTDYQNQVRTVVINRLNKGIADATAKCRDYLARNPKIAARGAPADPTKVFMGAPGMRCRILVYDAARVQPTYDAGVRYRDGVCTAAPAAVDTQHPLCKSLGIQITPIDPLRPPQQDDDLMNQLAPVTPKKILWDLDGNDSVDATCPGSAPVLRTILGYSTTGAGVKWAPRAVIVDANDTVAHFGRTRFVFPEGHSENTAFPGHLRNSQVFVCATSFDPPPNPQLPCITSGDIGRIHISDANLCPIDARDINGADFVQLLGGDLQQYLITASETRLAGEGAQAAAARYRSDGLAPVEYVGWDDERKAAPRAVGQAPTLDQLTSAAAANTAATLSSHVSGSDYLQPPQGFDAAVKQVTNAYDPAKAGLAFNQIYVARGAPMLVNGVQMNPVGDTATLLVPSDVEGALPNVHAMSLVGRDVASHLGPDIPGVGVPLTDGGELKQKITDAAGVAGDDLLRETNLDQMLDHAKAKGQSFVDDLKKKLDIEPFNLFGKSSVTIEDDGTATLHAHAELPGLVGANKGDALGADITIHADLQGHIRLEGIHLHADNATLVGINFSNLDVNFEPGVGLHITAKMLFPQLAGAGIDVKRFDLGPKGQFRAIDLDYLSGAGQGLPLGWGLFLTALGAHIDTATAEFGAHTIISVGTSVGGGCPPVGVDAGLTVRMADPWSVDGNADVIVACVKLGNLHFNANQSGAISLVGNANLDLGPLHAHFDLGAAFKMPLWQVWGDGTGSIDPILSGGVHAVISNRGLAGCGSVRIRVPIISDIIGAITGHKSITVAGGASIDFVDGRPPLSTIELINNLSLFTGCDIGGYFSLPRMVGPRAASPGSATFRLPAKAGPTLLSLEGAGAAPRVILHAPSGAVYDFSDATQTGGKRIGDDEAWGVVIPKENRTVAIIPRPTGGLWSATVAAGSPAVVRVRRAAVLGPVAVKGHVTGHGTHRVLHYRLGPQKGQSVRFVELAEGGVKPIKTVTHGSKGTVRYTVGEAGGKARRIVAQVTQDSHPRSNLTIARYSAPNPEIGQVRKLRVRRHGHKATISWKAGALDRTYLVRVDYGSGLRILLRPKPNAHRIVTRNVHKGEGLRVRVIPFSTAGRRGPTARTRLKGSMRLGSVRRTPRYRPHKRPRKHRHHH